MTDDTTLDFASVQAIITTESIEAHGAELHGVLTGLICAGFSFESDEYLVMINDLFNNGEGLPSKVKSTIKLMFAQVWQDIIDDSFSFQLLLPDDDETIVERGHALGAWVQGFNLGFGLQQKDKAVLSEDVKEVVTDFAEIANLSDEMEENEDTEQAYFEIAEYVRISALLCFTELGTPPEPKTEEETLH
jgi:yecA family protein